MAVQPVSRRVYFFLLWDSMYSTASLTRVIFSASSSGISIPNSSSNAMTSSTVSRESAPRSSTNDASGVTSSSSTPSCSTIMLLTLSATAIQFLHFKSYAFGLVAVCHPAHSPGHLTWPHHQMHRWPNRQSGLHVHAAVDRQDV